MRVLVTAGPTREPIDPVRYISNRSSGKMGYAIAQAALDAGHDVILISGPVNLAPPDEATFVSVSTSDVVPTRDVLDSIGHRQDRQFLVVGFAAETSDVEENAEQKLREKNCDIVVANDVSSADSGMDSDLNEVTIVSRNGERRKILRTQKTIIARELVKIFVKSATIMFDKKNVTVTETQLSEVIPNSSPVPRVAD